MKNIFLLPTDKPSRLSINYQTNLLQLGLENRMFHDNINIYITSDEEINVGDFVYDFITETVYQLFETPTKNEYKIILTTDSDLISYRVSPIDDDFLEWFIKNPSCESVEVSDYIKQIGWESDANGRDMILNKRFYEIIIPKEEQKQHIIEMMQNDEELGLYGANIIDTWLEKNGNPEIRKQVEREAEELEIEEVAENYGWRIKTNSFSDKVKANELAESAKQDFIEGVRWQKSRMYSEEDMRLAFEVGANFAYGRKEATRTDRLGHFNNWLKNYKK